MTKRRIALVSAIAGLTMVGGTVVITAIAEGIYNCNPDPYFPSMCTGQAAASLAFMIGPWLVATYLFARRELFERHGVAALFACFFMGLMWRLGLAGADLAQVYVEDLLRKFVYQDVVFSGFWEFFVIGGMAAILLIALFTAAIGSAMQVFRARHRKRLPHAA